MTEHDIVVYLFLCRCADQEGTSFPGRKKIAQACRISLDTVDRAIRHLEDLGLVKVERRTGTKGPETNQYTVLDPPVGVAAESGQGSRCERLGVAAESGQGDRCERLG